MINGFRDKAQTLITELHLLPALNLDASVPADVVLQKIRDTKHGIASVTSSGKLIGHIFERGIVRKYPDAKTAGDLSETLLFYLTIDSTIEYAMRMAIIKNLYYLPVLDREGIVCNYLSVRTLMEFILKHSENTIESFGALFEWETFRCDEHPGDINIRGKSEDQVHLNEQYYLRQLQVLDSRHLWCVDINDSVEAARKTIIERDVGVVAVTEFDTRVAGVLTERDFLTRVSIDPLEKALKSPVTAYYTMGPDTLQYGHRICYAINNIMKRGYRNIIIVNADKMPVAYISMIDILRFAVKSLLD